MSFLPKISIITPSFNQGEYIEQTILSVIEQSYKNFELIVIDGGSKDHTLEVIKKYQHAISYWVSEPDKGQAHAINKGLQIATGDIFNWINSDDLIEPGAFETIAAFFESNPHSNVLCGYTRCFWTDDNSTSHEYRMGLKSTVTDTIVNVEMNQPGTFYKTKLIKDFGGVNTTLRYVLDDEIWFRYLGKYGLSNVGTTDNRLAQFRLHKSSKSVGEGFDLFEKELQSIYLDIAESIHAPGWLLQCMNQGNLSAKYSSRGEWDMTNLDHNRYLAYFASKYINTLYVSDEKKLAKEALQMAINNRYFKWNRMMLSLRLKLLFY